MFVLIFCSENGLGAVVILPLVCTHVAAVHFLMSKNGNKITFAYGYAITLIKVILTVAPFLKTGHYAFHVLHVLYPCLPRTA